MGRRSRDIRQRRGVREARLGQETYWRSTAEERGCLFCRRSDGGFTSREHAFAESLGNTEIVLPPGVVCDRCNNQTLSQLDQVICEFMPISARRTMLGIPSKAGRIPPIRFSEGTVEYKPSTEPATDPILIFTSHGRRELLRETARYSDGRVELNWTATGGRRLTPRYASELSRALLKSAFECAWFDHGLDVFEPKFDQIRSAVLGEPRDGFFAAMSKANPDSRRVSLTYQFVVDDSDVWRMLVWADYYGVFIATDSRLSGPVIDVPEGLMNVISFTEADLQDTKGERSGGPYSVGVHGQRIGEGQVD